MDRMDTGLEEAVQVEPSMEHAFRCLEIQGTSPLDVRNKFSTELDNKPAAELIQQKHTTRNPRLEGARLPASSTVQLNKYFKNLLGK